MNKILQTDTSWYAQRALAAGSRTVLFLSACESLGEKDPATVEIKQVEAKMRVETLKGKGRRSLYGAHNHGLKPVGSRSHIAEEDRKSRS
jgi:hypothetical protein